MSNNILASYYVLLNFEYLHYVISLYHDGNFCFWYINFISYELWLLCTGWSCYISRVRLISYFFYRTSRLFEQMRMLYPHHQNNMCHVEHCIGCIYRVLIILDIKRYIYSPLELLTRFFFCPFHRKNIVENEFPDLN